MKSPPSPSRNHIILILFDTYIILLKYRIVENSQKAPQKSVLQFPGENVFFKIAFEKEPQ
jgi:hypothetical protein